MIDKRIKKCNNCFFMVEYIEAENPENKIMTCSVSGEFIEESGEYLIPEVSLFDASDCLMFKPAKKEVMLPQPPEGTIKMQQCGTTDSFECFRFDSKENHYIMIAVVHRPIGSDIYPIYTEGVWYWCKGR